MRQEARKYLKQMHGPENRFRSGQLEAIRSVVNGKRTLVVQRTGWGKSTVYFIATKILREKGYGVTILVSPLLSLMRNQIAAAEKLGLRAQTINSSNQGEWDGIKTLLEQDRVDILLISPERLGNERFIEEFLPIVHKGIGLFVVDEAHCISDWGHDFRPDYQRIVSIINTLPANTPILATTATANDRVVEDIKKQLGDDLMISRGPLLRESLRLQTIVLNDQAERLAWLVENVNKIEGSGIIYCLTISDCNKVTKWLQYKGIDALAYHSQLSDDRDINSELKVERENKLLNNEVKVLVATIALGMGFDKPDLAFVIHFQRPGSVVSYYQQIGRAGRSLENAFVVLLSGKEDDEIQDYFIRSAFPTSSEMKGIVELIEASEHGLRLYDILEKVNVTQGRLRKCLRKLIIDNIIAKEKSTYYRTPNPWVENSQKSQQITEMRYAELEDMRQFVNTKDCYMEYITKKLDDPDAHRCGKCSNCLGQPFFSEELANDKVNEAIHFLRKEFLTIKVRKRWPAHTVAIKQQAIAAEERNEEGKALSSYGDAGWGHVVRDGIHSDHCFSDDLVKASAELIAKWQKKSAPQWVTFVPSLRSPELVKGFAKRLALTLNLPFYEALTKIKDTPQQKTLENSYYQCTNALQGFATREKLNHAPVLLVDDTVDSGWTLTVCGSLLRKAGVEAVYPYALATTTKNGG